MFNTPILWWKSSGPTANKLETLTGRAEEILQLLAQGNTNQEIAGRLFISDHTVKRHLKAIFQKLDIHTRSAAAKAAGVAGLNPPPEPL